VDTRRTLDGVPGIQSIESGARLLRGFSQAPAPLTLTALAAAAGMPTSKARRYLVSFVRSGLVEQDGRGRYSLGPLAVSLGLAALAQVDVIQRSERVMRELRDQLNETVVLAVWGDRSPVIVRREDSALPITLNIRLGSSLPLNTSATGLVFAAVRSDADHPTATDSLRRRLDQVRHDGFAEIDGEYMAGIYAIGAPVSRYDGSTEAVLTVVAHSASATAARRREIRRRLLEATEHLAVDAIGRPAVEATTPPETDIG
jgi:DNA-binding IclR family transcriptional regulator